MNHEMSSRAHICQAGTLRPSHVRSRPTSSLAMSAPPASKVLPLANWSSKIASRNNSALVRLRRLQQLPRRECVPCYQLSWRIDPIRYSRPLLRSDLLRCSERLRYDSLIKRPEILGLSSYDQAGRYANAISKRQLDERGLI